MSILYTYIYIYNKLAQNDAGKTARTREKIANRMNQKQQSKKEKENNYLFLIIYDTYYKGMPDVSW